jgi:long-subunit acyl-CoA synthetase (AMP-forming)
MDSQTSEGYEMRSGNVGLSGAPPISPDVLDALDLLGFTVCEGHGLTDPPQSSTLNPSA